MPPVPRPSPPEESEGCGCWIGLVFLLGGLFWSGWVLQWFIRGELGLIPDYDIGWAYGAHIGFLLLISIPYSLVLAIAGWVMVRRGFTQGANRGR